MITTKTQKPAKLKIKKGDKVVVIAGKDKGKKGEVLEVSPKTLKVLVSGVNIVKKHQKPSYMSAGGVIQKEAPIHISNVNLEDPETGKPTRVSINYDKSGNKHRVAKVSGKRIDEDK
ncbi:MAG: 50S ribosomal protein L24 [Sphingobacteriia bacterium]|nr:50S ribosomal protein L24 [Sphingobacteriia bacterium]